MAGLVPRQPALVALELYGGDDGVTWGWTVKDGNGDPIDVSAGSWSAIAYTGRGVQAGSFAVDESGAASGALTFTASAATLSTLEGTAGLRWQVSWTQNDDPVVYVNGPLTVHASGFGATTGTQSDVSVLTVSSSDVEAS